MAGSTDQEIVLVIGVGVVMSAIVLFINTRRFVKTSESIEGEIVGYGVADGSNFESKTTTAVVRFSVEGKEYTFPARIMSKNKYYIGKKVDVIYDPEEPFNAYLNSVYHLYFMEMMSAIVGVSMIVAALFGY